MARNTPLTWKLQHSNRPRGRYFQVIYGKGKTRKALTFGYLSDDEEVLATTNLSSLPSPSSLLQVGAAPAVPHVPRRPDVLQEVLADPFEGHREPVALHQVG